jgi:putative heme-binding domain-containing protein
VWLLPNCGQKGFDRLTELLHHENQQIRVAAFRSLRRAASEPDTSNEIRHFWLQAREQACRDSAPSVRREAAISLRDEPFETCRELLKKLADGFDGWDRWYLEALGTACEGKEQEAYEILVSHSEDPLVWDHRLSGIAWRLHPDVAVGSLKTRAMTRTLPLVDRKQMVDAIAFNSSFQAASAMLDIAQHGPKDIRGYAAWWGQHRLQNDWKDIQLSEIFPKPPPIQKNEPSTRLDTSFIPPGQPVYKRSGKAAIKIDIRGAKRLYLVVDSTHNKSEEALWVAPILMTTESTVDLTQIPWTMAFSGGTPSGPPPSHIEVTARRKKKPARPALTVSPGLTHVDNTKPAIQVAGRSVIAYDVSALTPLQLHVTCRALSEETDTANHISFSIFVDRSIAGKDLLQTGILSNVNGSSSLGRAVFHSERVGCAKCHIVDGYGGEIGPDLTQIARKHSIVALQEDILKPHAAIAAGFETMTVLTTKGTVTSGLQVSAGDPVVLKDAGGTVHTISRKKIDEIFPATTSLMPELINLLTAEEVSSIISFLQSSASEE